MSSDEQSKKIWFTQYEQKGNAICYINVFDTPQNRLIYDLIGTLELEISKLKGKLDIEHGAHNPQLNGSDSSSTTVRENEETSV